MIGEILKKVARDKGINQKQLAEKTGLSRRAINFVFANKNYSRKSHQKIMDALGIKNIFVDPETDEINKTNIQIKIDYEE